ncbi:Hypothetical protein CINCED_3A001131 [Cinara cedri]|uniref:Uncharacterized protein n=1 Tax=Cinara cedri TaxID=506608 RepID=A0A5E4ME98_9HEMI|nr:Hypothetical protein CINCED_3A001131 [Cinara cedri]
MAYFCVPWLIRKLNPNKQQKQRFEEIGREKLKSLGAKNVKNLTDHELMIASQLVILCDITVSWKSIAGLSAVIDGIKQTVIFPVQRKELLRNSTLTNPPRGILFKIE